VVYWGEGAFDQLLRDLDARLAERASFFLGGRVALSAGDRPLSAEQLRTIGERLRSAGVSLWAVESDHPDTVEAARELGLEAGVEPPSVRSKTSAEPRAVEVVSGLIVRRTLRSGQALYHRGPVTLIGDVNAGAELVADGDVIVWGKLRGTVHAGAMGDDSAIVCALQMAPSQIRIGHHIARPPERSRASKQAEVASVQQGEIVVERWNAP